MGEDFTFVDENGAPIGANYHNIKVIGIGGCGNKALNHMIKMGLTGPEYIAANTDPQDLNSCLAPVKILLGEKLTRKRGCGGKPQVGKAACLESIDAIKVALKDTDLLFIAAGLGGGTGSGGAPVIAEALSQMERPPLIVGVVTTPFSWERHRKKIAEDVLKELTRSCNCIITISNSNVEKFAPKDSTMPQSIALANDVLYKALSGIIEILNTEGTINVDFADIEAILECRGPAFMAFGEAAGENRAKKAFQSAITNPIMSEQSIKGAKRMLINVIGDSNILATEFEEINHLAADLGAPDAVIFSGWVIDESLSESGTIKVTVLATGLDNSQEWDKPADEVINLDTLVEEPSVSVREEAELTQQRKEPIVQGVTQVPRESEQSAWGPPPSAGTNTQQQQGVTYPQTNAPKPPVRRRPTPGGSIVPGQLSRYEQNAGVDPDNPNSVFYDTPSFLRNKAN